MKWLKERDLLIAQTLAFVQSVTGKKPGPDLPDAGPDAALAEPAQQALEISGTIELAERAGSGDFSHELRISLPSVRDPQAESAVKVPRPIIASDFRAEILNRVANFRAHQERFTQEREQYCSRTMAKARASIDDAIADMPLRR